VGVKVSTCSSSAQRLSYLVKISVSYASIRPPTLQHQAHRSSSLQTNYFMYLSSAFGCLMDTQALISFDRTEERLARSTFLKSKLGNADG
jgi:hypothetical protein